MYVEILVGINIHRWLTDKKKGMSIQIHANFSYESRHLETVKNHKNIFFKLDTILKNSLILPGFLFCGSREASSKEVTSSNTTKVVRIHILTVNLIFHYSKTFINID